MTESKVAAVSDRQFYLLNALLSAGALALLAWLLLFRKPAPGEAALSGALSLLPLLNALLNTTSALLLLFGRAAIKRGDRRRHAQLMLAAFTTSALFLVSYLAYHFVHGDTRYLGAPSLRAIYLCVLASHVLLSVAVVPLVLAALWFAARGAFARHTKVTRVLYPIWLYVSVTGVSVTDLLPASARLALLLRELGGLLFALVEPLSLETTPSRANRLAGSATWPWHEDSRGRGGRGGGDYVCVYWWLLV